jgi:hypothetical protein
MSFCFEGAKGNVKWKCLDKEMRNQQVSGTWLGCDWSNKLSISESCLPHLYDSSSISLGPFCGSFFFNAGNT